MRKNHANNDNYLDIIRINDGINPCKDAFAKIHQENEPRAVALLNDGRLTFPSLFILLPQIESLRLDRSLNSRNLIVLEIIHQVLTPQHADGSPNHLAAKKKIDYPALKWIVETGSAEDRLNNEYEQILDVTASVLINTYKDKVTLPTIADMIFKRNRNGHYIHDLVWAFFQIRDPYALKLIAAYMLSSEQKDTNLAYNLLNIEATDKNGVPVDCQQQYQSYLKWLKENDPFLYFTGESFQFATNPAFCRIDLERKYMGKGIASYNKSPLIPLNSKEDRSVQTFQLLSDEEQTLLSEYAFNVRNKSVSEWKKWLASPIGEQIKAAKSGLEEVQ